MDAPRRATTFVLIALLAVLLATGFASAQNAGTPSELERLIGQLQEKIKSLEVEISALRSELETVSTELKFTRLLQRGASGDDVRQLQEFLARQHPDLYPEGLVTGFFGPLTEQAVRRWQERQGLEAVGVVGPKTRAKLNELIAEGAGESGLIPPGLLTAPGLAREAATGTPPLIPSAGAPPAGTTTPPIPPLAPLPTGATTTPATPPASAATTTSAQACAKTITVPSEKYPTVASALDAACAGDVIKIAGGSYLAGLSLTARHSNIALTGAGMDQTILQGTGTWGIALNGVTNVTVKNLTIERAGNQAIDGGGFWINRSNDVVIENVRVRDSLARQGGAVAVEHSSVAITRSLFDRNVARNSAGAISIRTNATTTLTNVTIASNTALGCHGGGLFVDPSSRVSVKNAIIWGNTGNQPAGSGCIAAPSIYGAPNVTYSDIQFGFSGPGNTDQNPYFVSPSRGDYHISSPSSAAYNSGDPSMTDPDGSRSDMGVFPYGTSELPIAPTPAPVITPPPVPAPGAPPSPTVETSTPPAATTTPPTSLTPPPPTTAPSGQTPPLWVRMLGGADNDRALAVAADRNGYSYVAGYVSASLDGQPYRGGSDAFVAKYDPNGSRLWIRELGSTRSGLGSAFGDAWTAAAVDSSGNVYLAGWSYGSLDGQPFSDNTDAILAKYDSNGTKLWVREFGSTLNDQLYGVAVDAAGNVYAAGLTDTALDGQANAGLMDALVVKYDTNGTKLWTRLLGTATYDRANAIALDYGIVYVGGWTRGPLGGETYTGNGSEDAFLTAYDPNGTRLWTRLLGGPGSEVAYGVAVGSAHAVYIAGQTSSSLAGQSNAGGLDVMTARYEADMRLLQWARQFGSSDQDTAYGVAADVYLNFYVTGSISGGLDGQANAGGTDAFIAKYDPNGNRVWTRLLGTGTSDVSQAVALDGSGNVFIAGGSWGALGGQSNAGQEDAFLAKFSGAATATPPPPPPPPPAAATTTAAADTTPPVISNIQVSFFTIISGQTVAKVTWTTDEAADTELAYGLDSLTGPGGNTHLYALGTTHSVQTDGLQSGGAYVYQVKSTDAAGNTAASTQQSFAVPITMPAAPFMLSPLGGEILTLNSASTLKWKSPAVGYQASLFLVDAATQSKTWRLYDTSAGYAGENAIPWVVGGYDNAWGYVVAGPYYARVCQRLDGPQYVNCDLSDGSFDIVSASAPPPPPPAADSSTNCTGLALSFQGSKTTYVQGETVTYTYTCTPGGSASYVEVQVVKPDGTATTYNSASGSVSTNTFGFGTANLSPGNYTLRTCFSAGCSSVTASLAFTIVVSAAVPPVPLNLTAAMASYSTATVKVVALKWSGGTSDITEFRVFNRLEGSAWPTSYDRRGLEGLISTAGGTIEVHIGLTAGAAGVYESKVQACNSAGCSADSNLAYVNTGASSRLPTPSSLASALEALTKILENLRKLLNGITPAR